MSKTVCEVNVVLVAKNVSKSYRTPSGELRVLKEVCLEIERGEAIALVGPSGAGKSTLLHILGALDSPSEGQVLIDGEDVYQMSDESRARLRNGKIGFVFQSYHLLPEFTALENVLLPVLVQEDKAGIKQFEQRGLEMMDQVGLRQRARHKPNQLSGGEQQRTAIARALINRPQIILCDEPTGNLDSKSGENIIDLLMELNRANKQTLLIVTHDEEIAKRADRVIHIRDGILMREQSSTCTN